MASAGFFAELSGLRIRSLRTDMRFLREGAARFGNWCKYKVRSYKGGPNVSSVFYSASCTASRKGQLSFGTRAESDSLLRRGSCRASGWRSGHPSREPSARRPPPHRATRSTMGCSRGQDSIPRRQLTAFV
ncbi:hypothetical protein MTO96_004696 [Rhipicephalus appendiculatus]